MSGIMCYMSVIYINNHQFSFTNTCVCLTVLKHIRSTATKWLYCIYTSTFSSAVKDFKMCEVWLTLFFTHSCKNVDILALPGASSWSQWVFW